jgi:hypothetical protein
MASNGSGGARHSSFAEPTRPAFNFNFADLVGKAAERISKLYGVGANDVGQLGTGQVHKAGLAKPEMITALKAR